MAITDISISEELETNAPSIKYRGNEGPKSPQEERMIMADAILEEEYNKYVFDLLEIRPEATPMTIEEFRQMVIAEGQMSKGPILPSPEDPVNPFGPKPIGPVLPDRQMAAYGGIMGLDGRQKYGLGDFVRKLIPNEVAAVAEKAAPFVAPFNPLAAGLMKGIGGFDRTGSIGDSLKSGLLTYGGGQLARGIGGGMGNLQGMSFKVPGGGEGLGAYFSNPIQDTGGLGKVFGNMKSSPGIEAKNLNDYEQATKFVDTGDQAFEFIRDKTIPGVDKGPGKIIETIKKYALDPKVLTGLAAGTLGATALMGNMEPEEIQDLQRGEGLDVEGIRAEVIEAFKDSSGEKLAALRSKYPFLGTRESKNIANMAMGGRIGFSKGKAVNFFANLFKPKPKPKFDVERFREGPIDLDFLENIDKKDLAPFIRTRDTMGPGGYGMYDDFADMPAGLQAAELINRIRGPRNTINYEAAEMFIGKKLKGNESVNELIEMLIEKKAEGGRIGKAEGGIMDLGGMEKDYRNTGGFVDLGAKEKADDVPARLSVNEFVFTADAVRNAGGGDIDKGAEVMENMMKNLEAGGQVSEESQGVQSLRAGGRAGFANGLTVDTDKVIEDIKKFSIPGLIGRGVKTGANKISDIDLETIIKVVSKITPSGMVMEKVTDFLVDRYGMSLDEAQMRIVNKLGTDANEGFKQPSGTSDEGYRMVGIESSAEDTSDIPIRNRLRNILDRAPSIEMPRPEKRFPEDDRYYPDGPGKFPERKPFVPGEGGDFERGPFRPGDGRDFELLRDMFNTSQRLSEVVE
jgi:predicted CopG family antitoxin